MFGIASSIELVKLGKRSAPVGLLAFLITAFLVPTMADLGRADMWDDTLAKAKKEGKLVAALGGSASRNYRPIFKIFEKKFGIETVVSTGGGGTQADRLLAERRAGRYAVDIFMAGPTVGNSRIIANNAGEPIKDLLFLPDVVDQSLWYKKRHQYSDPQQKYIFALSGNAEFAPIGMRFNTNKLSIKDAKKIKSSWEFLDKRFAGQVVALPPTAVGALGTYVTVQFHPDLGEKFLRRFFDPEVNIQFTHDFRQLADGVAKGKYTMAIFAGSAGRDIDRLGRRGLPVANFGRLLDKPIKERPLLQGSGSANNLMVIDKQPHPYASKLFVNWFLSKEGQTLMHTKSARTPDQTFREDVTEMGKVNPAEIRRPDVDYMNFSHNPKVLGRQSWALKNAVKLYRQIRHN